MCGCQLVTAMVKHPGRSAVDHSWVTFCLVGTLCGGLDGSEM